MQKYDYAHEPSLFNQSQVCFREPQGLRTCTARTPPLGNVGSIVIIAKITSQDKFQITTVAGAIFYDGSQWGLNADFNHSEGEQRRVVKVGSYTEHCISRYSTSIVHLWRTGCFDSAST